MCGRGPDYYLYCVKSRLISSHILIVFYRVFWVPEGVDTLLTVLLFAVLSVACFLVFFFVNSFTFFSFSFLFQRIRVVYFEKEEFPEIEEFMRKVSNTYGFEFLKYAVSYKDGMRDLVDNYGVKVRRLLFSVDH